MRSDRSRRLIVSLVSFVALMVMASSAHAHGGMASADDLGPPLFTSAALAFVCYWLVILWPKSKRNNSDGVSAEGLPRHRKTKSASGRTRNKASARDHSLLTKVIDRSSIDFDSRRTAGDA